MTEQYKTKEANFWVKRLADAIKGGTVTDVFAIEEGEFKRDIFIGFDIAFADGKINRIILLSDEEGNGRGRFEVQSVRRI